MSFATVCLVIAAVLPIACAAIAKWGLGDYDNRNPRAWLAAQTGGRARAVAAQANSWEAFPVFAAGVLVAMQAGASPLTVDLLAGFFVASRIAYIWLYVTDRATAPSIVWTFGFLASLALYFAALW
jgi:uncharacterized MAPEG superfamily protein